MLTVAPAAHASQAAITSVGMTVASRNFVLPIAPMLLPPLAMGVLRSALPGLKGITAVAAEVALVAGSIYFALPVAIAIFPQARAGAAYRPPSREWCAFLTVSPWRIRREREACSSARATTCTEDLPSHFGNPPLKTVHHELFTPRRDTFPLRHRSSPSRRSTRHTRRYSRRYTRYARYATGALHPDERPRARVPGPQR